MTILIDILLACAATFLWLNGILRYVAILMMVYVCYEVMPSPWGLGAACVLLIAAEPLVSRSTSRDLQKMDNDNPHVRNLQ